MSLASPEKTLAQMIDWEQEMKFATYLAGGSLAYHWDAILLSAGGNDLSDAILTLPGETDPVKAKFRLLQNPELVPVGTSPTRYLRSDGWEAFFSTWLGYFVAFLAKRDEAGSESKNVPVFGHTDDCPQPRLARAGPGIGPWLSRAYTAYKIPANDWLPLTTYIVQ
jgi:hypothetical protein